jgi:hypothetical protein
MGVMRRCGWVAALAAAMLVAGAGSAMADPARPTNYASTVTGVESPTPGIHAEVTGGDAFLAIRVDPGVEVVVPGYRDEPYIRVDADGSVFENRNSPAFWLNNDRYGDSVVPPEATPEAEPDWHQVASGGQWAWHDHRIHWMTPDLPPSLQGEEAGEVFTWSVPFEIDGESGEVTGVLVRRSSQSPLLWIVLGVVLGAIALAVGRLGVTATGIAVTIGGAAALAVSLSQASITPPGAGGELVSQGAAVLATVGGLVTLVFGRRIAAVGDLPALIGAMLLVVWGLRRITALWMPVLPTPMPAGTERFLVAAALGIAGGVVIAGFMRRLAGASRPAPA